MKEEIWKDISTHKGLYQVSSFGRVRSLDRCVISAPSRRFPFGIEQNYKGKILQPLLGTNGYLHVTLSKTNTVTKRKKYSIHRLVLAQFSENTNNYDCVNHKDENRLNNHIDNLEWCDHKYNSNYGNCIIKSATSRGIAVDQYTLDGTYVQSYISLRRAAQSISKQAQGSEIRKACTGKYKKCYGYKWKFKQI